MYQLPDCDPFKYNAWSGYLNVSSSKSLHYTFVESQSNPEKDPLMLWFNGGPGCSSLLGFFQEHGPFVIDDNQTYIHENEYPWNLKANVAYIESPAGVGYSWAADKEDLV
jgi:carboxypeptidase C (cathepsin A)